MAPTPQPYLSADDELHWIALRLIPGLGSRRALDLLKPFKSPQGIFRASTDELMGQGLSGSLARTISSGCVFEDAIAQHAKIKATGAHLIAYADPRYPSRLKEIYDPPVVLHARGRLELLSTVTIAVVGTRRPSPYGMAAAERLATDLSLAGLTIASGMARGIDTAAHKAALAAGGNTVAVFGGGVDVCYPAENRKLAQDIAQSGLVLSEFPMGSPSYPQNFPIRNRIVAGLSVGVLVVEGAQYSGSAITARLAMDQGREVFAVPGNITSKQSWGPNLLIKQGAKLVQDWNDVLEELSPADRIQLQATAAQRGLEFVENEDDHDAIAEPRDPLEAACRRVLAQLAFDKPTQLDQLIELLDGLSSSEVIAALFDLEMQGHVKQLPGKLYLRTWQ